MPENEDPEVTTSRLRWLPKSGLWGNPDFLRVWGAQSTSLFGTALTLLAFPLLAITQLNASAFEMGLLVAAETSPFFFCSLFAGVWVDRHARRSILILTDLLRAGLLLSIPLAVWLGMLRIEQMYVIAFIIGVFGVFFEIAHYAYVPSLVGRENVVEANSKLQISHSAAEAGGPGVAGLLIQLVSAPFALVLDAGSYLVSALFLRRIEAAEPPIERPAAGATSSVLQDARDGLRMLLGHPLLRPIVLASICGSIFINAITALYILYATRDLNISPFVLGLIFTAGGLGAIPGALISAPVARRFGVRPTIICAWIVTQATWLLIPLAAGWLTVPILAFRALLSGVLGTIYNIQQWSLRQLVTPDAMQGRVTASHRFLVYGAFPIDALLGGWLGTTLGLRQAITICAFGALVSPLWLVFSPLRQLREQPADAR